jgi:cyclic nucleotide-binding protein
VETALPFVRDESEAVASAALAAVAAGDHPRRAALLAAELRRWVALSWSAQVGLGLLERRGGIRGRFLRLAVIDALLRHRRMAFLALAAIESPRVVRRVERALRFGTARSRGDALEVLSNLGDRTAARVLVVMHEPGPVEERAASLGSAVAVPRSRDSFLAELKRSSDRWLQLALAAGDDALGDTPGAAIMERLLALKRVPLFENLTLDQLDALQQFARDAAFLPGEVIVREGDLGGELFLLLEGKAEAWLDYRGPQQQRLSVIDAGGYFGEMAILDDSPRSATVVALEPVRLLALDGDSLKALLRQMPEIGLELLRVMTARVRASERRLLEGKEAGA